MRSSISVLFVLLLAWRASAQPSARDASPDAASGARPTVGTAPTDSETPQLSSSADGTRASPPDSPIGIDATPYDPLPNRLFFMPTGRLLPSGRLAAEVFDLTGLRAAYGLSGSMQVGLSGVYSPFKGFPSFVTAGGTVRVLRGSGMFRGLTAGADFGYLGINTTPSYQGAVQSYNLAATFGDEEGAFHINVSALPRGTSDTTTLDIRYLFQTGLGLPLIEGDARDGLMAMGEVWFGGRSLRDIHPVFAMAGVRGFVGAVSWEVGALLGPRCLGDCDGEMLSISPLPYLSAIWLF